MQVLEQMETAKKKKSVQGDSTEILSVLPPSAATTLHSAHRALQQAWFPWGSPSNSYLQNIQNDFHSLYVSASKLVVLM